MSRIIVGLSGGVDSAVSAWLLQRAGHEVEGLFMVNWAEDDDAYCTVAEDFDSAQAVSAELGIPLHRADFSEAYRDRVFAHFLREYERGRTPNPDLLCNREIKFGEFAGHARKLGADAIATGHYARLWHEVSGTQLHLARDPGKDQTYFLAAVARESLADVVFPLGTLRKDEVRRLAAEAGLPNHTRRDSTGICFVGERPMREFLSRYLDTSAGPIVDTQGRTLGEHPGLCYFTLGQRKGLGIGGVAGADEAPWYVAAKREQDNALVVTQDHDDALLLSRDLVCTDVNWLVPEVPDEMRCHVRIRHRGALEPALLSRSGDSLGIRFETPVWGAAPGQYAVIYAGSRCLASAVIEQR